jgi:hypothetical protein
VRKALHENAWVWKIFLDENLTMAHLHQIVDLWVLTNELQLIEETKHDISWNLMADGQYSAGSAYDAQFIASTFSFLQKPVCKAWTPPKTKKFAWLLTQNRISTTDHLGKYRWPNYGLCHLCKQINESVCHLFVECKYIVCLWNYIQQWLGIPTYNQTNGVASLLNFGGVA